MSHLNLKVSGAISSLEEGLAEAGVGGCLVPNKLEACLQRLLGELCHALCGVHACQWQAHIQIHGVMRFPTDHSISDEACIQQPSWNTAIAVRLGYSF